MQFTTKFAFLAAAVAGALAAPLVAREVEYELDAREVEDLSAREFYDMYLEVRADPTLDARTVEAMDLEAREYLEYLEAREATAAAIQKPLEPVSSTPHAAKVRPAVRDDKAVHYDDHRGSRQPSKSVKSVRAKDQGSHILFKPSRAQKKDLSDPKALQAALNDAKNPLHDAASYINRKKLAVQDLKQNPEHMKKALSDPENRFHRLAVNTYFSDKTKLAAALKDKKSPHYRDAKRFQHRQEAKKYFKRKGNFKKALSNKKDRYHKQAVRQYLNNPKHFDAAFHNPKSRFHGAAVRMYLRHNPSVYRAALKDPKNQYHKAALSLYKKRHGSKKHGHQNHGRKPTEPRKGAEYPSTTPAASLGAPPAARVVPSPAAANAVAQ